MTRAPIRLAYLATHPIQYQAPLLKRIAAEPGIDLTVFFRSDWSVSGFDDPGFGRRIEWDVPLLEGYRHQFLPAWGDATRLTPFWRPFSRGLARRLIASRAEILWVHGYARFFHWLALAEAKALGLKLLLRDEATAISAPRTPSRRAAKRAFFLGLRQLVDGYLAIGSLNYHRRFFGERCEISFNREPAHTGCVGFGIERWIQALTVDPSCANSRCR